MSAVASCVWSPQLLSGSRLSSESRGWKRSLLKAHGTPSQWLFSPRIYQAFQSPFCSRCIFETHKILHLALHSWIFGIFSVGFESYPLSRSLRTFLSPSWDPEHMASCIPLSNFLKQHSLHRDRWKKKKHKSRRPEVGYVICLDQS